MKKAFALVLALTLLLSLTACGEPEQTSAPDATNEAEDVQLVTSYTSDSDVVSVILDSAYTMDFSYNADYTGGTVELTYGSESLQGSFTCDENYNINSIRLQKEIYELRLDMTFDSSHRLLTATVETTDGTSSELFYTTSREYDAAGRVITNAVEDYRRSLSLLTKMEYDDAGRLLRQSSTALGNTTIMEYIYGWDGYMTEMRISSVNAGGEEKLQDALFAQYVVKNNRICYRLQETPDAGDADMIYLEVDMQGHFLLQEQHSGGELISRIEQTYDENGRLIRTRIETVLSADTVTEIIYTYTYTVDGRPAEQICWMDGYQQSRTATTFKTVKIPG